MEYRRNKRPLVFNLPLEKYFSQSLSGSGIIINTLNTYHNPAQADATEPDDAYRLLAFRMGGR